MKNNLTLGVLITTMNNRIERVKKKLLPQLKGVDEVIISHQITDKNIQSEQKKLGKNIKYFSMSDKGLSKNRNNALKYSTTDICHICDDDLDFVPGFEKIIKKEYQKTKADLITFQAENKKGKQHFQVKEGKHNRFSILRIWSWGITFRRKSLEKYNIMFNENFGLGTQYPVGEENLFLTECYKKRLKLTHSYQSIVIHPDESSGINYKGRKDLIIARIKVFKYMYGILGGLAAIFYFTIVHHKFYKKYFSMKKFFLLSWKSLKNGK